jgi:hypothetical protein
MAIENWSLVILPLDVLRRVRQHAGKMSASKIRFSLACATGAAPFRAGARQSNFLSVFLITAITKNQVRLRAGLY